MTQIEVKITIDDCNCDCGKKQVKALADLFTMMSADTTCTTQEDAKPTKKSPKQVTKSVATGPGNAPETECGHEAHGSEVGECMNSTPEIRVEDVRALLAKKVEANRLAIKTKLSELGAQNVTALDKERYFEFIEFLNTLKND